MKTLLQRAAIELWARSEHLEVMGSLCTDSVGSVVWPLELKRLVLHRDFFIPMENLSFPVRLQSVSFGCSFNQPIAEVVFPAHLEVLRFGNTFNQDIASMVWPASLQQL
ncbi:unnamed protein product [Ectocarpus fasciculatus]